MKPLQKIIVTNFFIISLFTTIVLFVNGCKPTRETQKSPSGANQKEDSTKTVQQNPAKKDTVGILEPDALNIGFLLPFALSENLKPVEDDLQPEELVPASIAYLEFYEGAKMAADSMNYDQKKIPMVM